LLTGLGCARITHTESLGIIVLLRGARAERRGRERIRSRGAKEEATHRPKKLTRPDGEIRAGRVDRRRGSGGRERRSGLEFRPCRPVRLLVSASRQKVQADFWGPTVILCLPFFRQTIAVRKENTRDFKPLPARRRNNFGRRPGRRRLERQDGPV